MRKNVADCHSVTLHIRSFIFHFVSTYQSFQYNTRTPYCACAVFLEPSGIRTIEHHERIEDPKNRKKYIDYHCADILKMQISARNCKESTKNHDLRHFCYLMIHCALAFVRIAIIRKK